ncbi:MAG: hypothetical protein OHK0029_04420 [Armatimonadaceae bacterium]
MRPFWKRKNNVNETLVAGEAENGASAPQGGVVTTTSTLRDVLAVTYMVPADRVRSLLPDGLHPDLLPDTEGSLCGFLQTLCAYYENARWSPLPGGLGTSYHQIVYRVLTRRNGVRGAFIKQTFISDNEMQFGRRAIEQTMDHARFSVYVDGDPARAAYRRYTLRATGDRDRTELEATALAELPPPPSPFRDHEELYRFLLWREELYFQATVPKNALGLVPVQYGAVTATGATLTSAKLSPWTRAESLDEETLIQPFSTLIVPELTVVTSPPRYPKRPERTEAVTS